MVLPTQDWGGVELRWAGRLIDGSDATGRLVITADAQRWLDDDPTSAISIFAVPIIVPIVDGVATVVVPATDDPDITPNGFTYTIREELTKGVGTSFTIEVPLAAKADGIDLNRVVQVAPAAGTPVEPVTRAELDALAYRYVRLDQVAIALDTDGVPYWGNDIPLADALPVLTDTDGQPYVSVPE